MQYKELIESKFISIPNIVADSFISNDAKLLYGYIRYWDYMHDTRKTLIEISKAINCSENTARKCIKELEKMEFLRVETINKFKKILYPQISDGIMLDIATTNKNKNEYNKLSEYEKEMLELKNKGITIPQEVQDFFNKIK